MKNTQLLLINDMCGYGKVALSAMLPVLSHMFHLYKWTVFKTPCVRKKLPVAGSGDTDNPKRKNAGTVF